MSVRGLTLRIAGILQRIAYPARVKGPANGLTTPEVEAWVEASRQQYFEALDRALVERAKALGVSQGMMLDLESPLGLLPMKILWEEDELLCIGVYRSLPMAERARKTAEAWNLDDRMFFQVGDLEQMRFKTEYFDVVISDGALRSFEDPLKALREIRRVTKPSGAILLRELRRPSRFGLAKHLTRHRDAYPSGLQTCHEFGVRGGFTRAELIKLANRAGIEGTHIYAEEAHVVLERAGRNDPTSWVTEREKYF